MRNNFYKFLPWVLGGLIGFFLFRPPAFLTDPGPLAWVVQGARLAAALLSVVMLMLLGNLPETLEMRMISDGEVPKDVHGIAAQIEALGFQRVGAPWRVQVAPAATLIGFVHPDAPVYATAFCTGTVPAKVSFDFVSILDGPRGGLRQKVQRIERLGHVLAANHVDDPAHLARRTPNVLAYRSCFHCFGGHWSFIMGRIATVKASPNDE